PAAPSSCQQNPPCFSPSRGAFYCDTGEKCVFPEGAKAEGACVTDDKCSGAATTAYTAPSCWKCEPQLYSLRKGDNSCDSFCGEASDTTSQCYESACVAATTVKPVASSTTDAERTTTSTIPEDFTPPKIENFAASPDKGTSGNVFTITATITDETGVSNAGINVKRGENLIKTLSLYDDGFHGDEKAADHIYGNTWDSAGLATGSYDVTIEAADANNNKNNAAISVELIPDRSLCREVLSGHNDITQNRINVVFAGYDYPYATTVDKNVYRSILQQAAGFTDIGGVLQQEPFFSNKNKFNFWYIDPRTAPDVVYPLSGFDVLDVKYGTMLHTDASKAIASACPGAPNTYIAIFANHDFRSFAYANIPVSFMSRMIDSSHYSGPYYYTTFTHEFGHTFREKYSDFLTHPLVNDEYITNTYPAKVDAKGEFFVNMQNVNIAPDSECKRWKNLIGNGCGAPGIVDCVVAYNPISNALQCNGDPMCFNEVGCFKGAIFSDFYRPTYSSIMRDNKMAFSTLTPRAFGLINEIHFCKKIKELTGSAGGICDELLPLGENEGYIEPPADVHITNVNHAVNGQIVTIKAAVTSKITKDVTIRLAFLPTCGKTYIKGYDNFEHQYLKFVLPAGGSVDKEYDFMPAASDCQVEVSINTDDPVLFIQEMKRLSISSPTGG
ncbi:MAG: hypothetical protein HY365_00645, partial [Candidatus Aenigmarchaeota archaeon]|nr:hypothetical protein [Candidatus Aenigmarchaeota archaeon]